MSEKSRPRPAPSSGNGGSSRASGGVGYCRPPKEHQFKPGQSGNPKGRPKGAKGEDTIFREVINTRVPMSLRGRVLKVTLLQAVWMRIADDALKGNAKAQTLLINRSRALESAAPENREMHEDDEKVLQSYLRQVAAELEAQKVTS